MKFKYLIFIPIILIGCSHTIAVNTSPPGASVYFEGRYIGKSPCEIKTTSGKPGWTRWIRIQKSGYQEVNLLIKHNQIKDMSAGEWFCVFYPGMAIPLLFLWVPESEINIEMERR